MNLECCGKAVEAWKEVRKATLTLFRVNLPENPKDHQRKEGAEMRNATGYVESNRVIKGEFGKQAPGHLNFFFYGDSQTFEFSVIHHLDKLENPQQYGRIKNERPTLAQLKVSREAAVEFARAILAAAGVQ